MGVNNRYKGTCSSNAALVNKYVGTAYDHVKTVSDNIEDVKTVADALGDDFPDEGLDILVNNIDDIVTNAENISDINTVAGIKDDVVTVAGIEQEIIDVPSYTAQAIDAANAAEEDADRAETEADRATEQADLAANIADPYKGLWPDVGGSADKGDVYQTQVGGVGTGQYFTALQDTAVAPISDDVNWRSVITKQAIGDLTNYQATSVADMIAGISVNGSVDLIGGQLWVVNGQTYRCESSAPLGIEDFSEVSAKERQQVLMGDFYGKIQKDDGTQTITIACRGDSLTYGEDTTVDPQPANPTPTPSGRVHAKTRASTPYPDALQTYLQPLFSNTVNVINQGYSGDNTSAGWSDWDVDVSSDLTVIMYGTNDAAFGFSPYQSVEDYIKYYRLIILRELFERNAPVILVTPPPQKQVLSNNRLLDGYRMAVYQLGLEFGAPVIDGVEAFKNVDSTLFSDNVHFRTLGYQWLASAVQARILSKPDNFTSVSGGSNMTVRFSEDGVKAKWSSWNVQTAKASQVTPPLTSFSGGYVVETSSYFEKICFSFYCEQDDIIAMPNIEIENATVAVQLNNGIWQSQYTFDDRVQSTGDLTAKPDALYEYSAINESVSINRNSAYEVSKANRIHIATRGWKTLTLYIKSNGSTGSSRLTVGGVNFESYETVEMWDRHLYGAFGQQKPLGNVTPRYIGQFYTDTTPATAANPTTQVVWLATGLTSANWKVISNIDVGQSLLPTGNVTPYSIGQMYLDTTSGQFKWYKASGLTDSSWIQISNN